MISEIGPYRVERELGRGANGVVLRAQGPRGPVAIKLLLPERLEDPEDVSRFHREGEIAARLQHPAIVSLLDRGVCAKGPYHVYAFVEGPSLRQRIRGRGRLGAHEAASLALELCGGLEHAHAHGVLHRDLKPANVIVTPAGEPRLTDFGLAQDSVSDSRLTLSGEIMGSPVYMPPEQAKGQRDWQGPASDVYGLGAILYSMLVGKPPIEGGNLEEVLRRVCSEPVVSPATLVPGTPVELAAICMRCLEKHPGDRYATMRLLAADLRAFLEPEKPAPSASPPRTAEPRLLFAVAALALLGVAALLAVTVAHVSGDSPTEPPPESGQALDSGAWPADSEPEVTVADHLRDAEEALARHDHGAAERALQSALELDAHSGAAQFLLGKLAEDRGERRAAIAAWGRAAELGNTDYQAELATLYPNPDERRLMWITVNTGEAELAEAALLCNKLIDSPELDIEEVLLQFDEIADGFRPRLKGLSGRARLTRLLELCKTEVAQGSMMDYYNPANSRLKYVLESKEGVHITCVLCLIALGRRLGVELQGVCFPGWFLARTPDEPLMISAYDGRILTEDQIDWVFRKNTSRREFSPDLLQAATRQEILVRLVLFQAGNYRDLKRSEELQRGIDLARLIAMDDPEGVRKRAFGER